MKPRSTTRRRFIKAGIAASALGAMPWKTIHAVTLHANELQVPENIRSEIRKIYGAQASTIHETDRLTLRAPAIAENSSTVGVNVKGEPGLVTSLAVFVEHNQRPLAASCKFHEGADLAVAMRLRFDRSSNVYLVAQTRNGLVGAMTSVKITIGCGGA